MDSAGESQSDDALDVQTSERPAQLWEASVALAYGTWLEANGLDDSDLNAWKFVAAANVDSASYQTALTDRATAREGEDNASRRTWIPIIIVLAVVVALTIFVAFAFMSARHWTKVDSEETGHYVEVGDGTWTVTMDDKDVCYVDQDWGECIDEHTSEWNFACAERAHDGASRKLCDDYYDMIQEMKVAGAGDGNFFVETLGTWGRLSISENTAREWVVDEPEKTHDAVCYLGFLGECE